MVIVAPAARSRMASAALRPAIPEPTITNRAIGSPLRPSRQGNALEVEHAARAALDALPAGQTVTAVDGQAPAGVGAHVDADGTVVRADAALDAARRLWHDLPLRQHLMPG